MWVLDRVLNFIVFVGLSLIYDLKSFQLRDKLFFIFVIFFVLYIVFIFELSELLF